MNARLLPWLFRDEIFRIETSRLWLRWPRLDDCEALQAIAARKDIATMTASWQHPLPDGEALRRIEGIRRANASGAGIALAITRKVNPGRLIGTVGAHVRPDGALGLGYFLETGNQGRGLMTEAVRALVFTLFSHAPHAVISASSRIINPASRRVLEKSGFEPTGCERIETSARGAIEVDTFALSREAWRRSLVTARAAALIAGREARVA